MSLVGNTGPVPQRVIVIGPSNIGDAVLAGEALAQVRAGCPSAQLILVVGERATALFRDDPRIQTLINAGLYEGPLGRARLAFRLWRARPTQVVDLRHTLYPFLLKPWSSWRYLLRPPRRLVHMRDRHLWLLHAQLPTCKKVEGRRWSSPVGDILSEGPPANLSRAESREAGARVEGSKVEAVLPSTFHLPPSTSVWWSERDEAHVKTLMQRWRLESHGRIVVVCPGARSHIKRWTAEGFARVADRLIEEAKAQVIFSGEPDERPMVEEVLGLMGRRAHNAVGLTTVRQLAVLMGGVRLVITNDSAALHVASAVGAPTLALFGPTDEGAYGPTAPRSRVIRRRLFCAPCEQPLCRFSHECMRFIGPDEVYQAAVALLRDGQVTGER
jgi:ADP-heptose:LPS heptosyltransferase